MIDEPLTPHLRRTGRSLPIALLRARETVMGPIRDMLATSGVNEQKWRVLRVLDEGGPLELTHLASQACLLLPSLTRIVRAMEDESLIARATPASDRRKTIVQITAAGRAVIMTHAGDSQALFAQLEQRFGHDNLEALLDLLETLQSVELKGETAVK